MGSITNENGAKPDPNEFQIGTRILYQIAKKGREHEGLIMTYSATHERMIIRNYHKDENESFNLDLITISAVLNLDGSMQTSIRTMPSEDPEGYDGAYSPTVVQYPVGTSLLVKRTKSMYQDSPPLGITILEWDGQNRVRVQTHGENGTATWHHRKAFEVIKELAENETYEAIPAPGESKSLSNNLYAAGSVLRLKYLPDDSEHEVVIQSWNLNENPQLPYSVVLASPENLKVFVPALSSDYEIVKVISGTFLEDPTRRPTGEKVGEIPHSNVVPGEFPSILKPDEEDLQPKPDKDGADMFYHLTELKRLGAKSGMKVEVTFK
jgi:hypothetical protein